MQSAGFWKQSWNTFKRICALPLIALVKFYQHLPVHASVVPLHADLLAICPRSTA